MSAHRYWFHTYKLIYKGLMFMGNYHTLEIVGMSTIKLKIYGGPIYTIQEVVYEGLEEESFIFGTIR